MALQPLVSVSTAYPCASKYVRIVLNNASSSSAYNTVLIFVEGRGRALTSCQSKLSDA